VPVPESGSHSVAVTLLAHLRRARDHIDRNYCEPLDPDGLARVACYHAETAGHPFGDSSASSPALQKGGTGVEAVTRDNRGNWVVLVEPREFAPENFK
jgi:hypothetical protein